MEIRYIPINVNKRITDQAIEIIRNNHYQVFYNNARIECASSRSNSSYEILWDEKLSTACIVIDYIDNFINDIYLDRVSSIYRFNDQISSIEHPYDELVYRYNEESSQYMLIYYPDREKVKSVLSMKGNIHVLYKTFKESQYKGFILTDMCNICKGNRDEIYLDRFGDDDYDDKYFKPVNSDKEYEKIIGLGKDLMKINAVYKNLNNAIKNASKVKFFHYILAVY